MVKKDLPDRQQRILQPEKQWLRNFFKNFLDRKTQYLQGLSDCLTLAETNNFVLRAPSLKKCAIVAGSAFEKCFKKVFDKAGETPRFDRALIIVS